MDNIKLHNLHSEIYGVVRANLISTANLTIYVSNTVLGITKIKVKKKKIIASALA